METFSVIFLALITRVYSMCSITGKSYQELAISSERSPWEQEL